MDMHAAKFGTPVKHWENLSRVQQLERIKCAFNSLLLLKIIVTKHNSH
jgi:hypothetical protein